MTFPQFRDRVREHVDGAVGAEPPVSFDDPACLWRRGKLRVTLVLASDGETVLASRTAADLFRVSNTLGMRYPLTAEGIDQCSKIVAGWLNNATLYLQS
jgi:hypothetical protein